MDGGVANNTPISHAVELGAQRDLRAPDRPCLRAWRSRRAVRSAMALHAISLLTHRRLIDDVEKHRDDAKLVVLPPPCPLRDPADRLRPRRHADRSAATRTPCEFLDSGGAERPPIRMRMHRHDARRT